MKKPKHLRKRKPKIRLNAPTSSRVSQARKKLHKNPAFGKFGGQDVKLPTGMLEAACDMTVLLLLKRLGGSSQSILGAVLPIAEELLERHGVIRKDAPVGVEFTPIVPPFSRGSQN